MAVDGIAGPRVGSYERNHAAAKGDSGAGLGVLRLPTSCYTREGSLSSPDKPRPSLNQFR